MGRLFASSELIFADPFDPALRSIAEPVLEQVVARNSEIRDAVVARSRALSEAGYHEQVKVDSNFTGLFALKGESRQTLKPDELGSTVKSLNANVLVRPVVQDSIFPTAVFVAGPAKISYLAQAAVVYDSIGKEIPPVYPRISASVLEPRVEKLLRKYGLQFLDVVEGKDRMKRKAIESVQGVDLFQTVKAGVAEHLESLRATLTGVDPTLGGALDTAKQKMIYQAETLETKFINAVARRNEVMEKQFDLISHSLFPEKKLQERYLNVTSFIARYGLGFVNSLEQKLAVDSTGHQLIEI